MVLGYAWNPLLALAAAAAGYVLGNFQTAILISKRAFHDDVREHGSGNAGTTNMIRVFGMKPGIVTFIGDCAKAIAGVLLGRLIMGTLGGYIAGLFVIVGHCWPVFAGFRGGKGVASSLGIAWMTFPLGAAITTAAAVITFLFSRKISLCSLIGTAVLFVSVLIFRFSDLALVLLAAMIVLLVYVRHKENICRLIHGGEKRIVN